MILGRPIQGENMKTRAQFAATNDLFREACRLAGLVPSRHQAKRWQTSQGLAFQQRGAACLSLKKPPKKPSDRARAQRRRQQRELS
jgi:hypothetical protein